jgi:hypothetical protein
VACSVLGQLTWLAAILGKKMPAAGCTSTTPAAMPSSEGGENSCFPPRMAATRDPEGTFKQAPAEGGPPAMCLGGLERVLATTLVAPAI